MNGQLPPNCPPPPDGLPSYMGVKKDLPPKQADLIQEPTMVQGGDPQQLAEMPDLGKGKSKYQPKKCEHNRYGSCRVRERAPASRVSAPGWGKHGLCGVAPAPFERGRRASCSALSLVAI